MNVWWLCALHFKQYAIWHTFFSKSEGKNTIWLWFKRPLSKRKAWLNTQLRFCAFLPLRFSCAPRWRHIIFHFESLYRNVLTSVPWWTGNHEHTHTSVVVSQQGHTFTVLQLLGYSVCVAIWQEIDRRYSPVLMTHSCTDTCSNFTYIFPQVAWKQFSKADSASRQPLSQGNNYRVREDIYYPVHLVSLYSWGHLVNSLSSSCLLIEQLQ